MTIAGGRTKQLIIFCHVTGFMGDFLSFIVVELIPFFHGAFQLVQLSLSCTCTVCLSFALIISMHIQNEPEKAEEFLETFCYVLTASQKKLSYF